MVVEAVFALGVCTEDTADSIYDSLLKVGDNSGWIRLKPYCGEHLFVDGLSFARKEGVHTTDCISTQCQLHTKPEARKNVPFDTTARSKQHVRVVQWRLTTYT